MTFCILGRSSSRICMSISFCSARKAFQPGSERKNASVAFIFLRRSLSLAKLADVSLDAAAGAFFVVVAGVSTLFTGAAGLVAVGFLVVVAAGLAVVAGFLVVAVAGLAVVAGFLVVAAAGLAVAVGFWVAAVGFFAGAAGLAGVVAFFAGADGFLAAVLAETCLVATVSALDGVFLVAIISA